MPGAFLVTNNETGKSNSLALISTLIFPIICPTKPFTPKTINSNPPSTPSFQTNPVFAKALLDEGQSYILNQGFSLVTRQAGVLPTHF